VPRGYDPDHPLAQDLKRKDFTLGMPVADNEIVGSGILELTLTKFRKAAPFVQFLSDAVGMP
jgi:uncharacterized protein (DUF2461 family)